MKNLKKEAEQFLVLSQDKNISQTAYLLGIDTMKMGLNDSITISADAYDNVLTIEVLKSVDEEIINDLVDKANEIGNSKVEVKWV
jgi:N-acetylglutamate synthase-like GNAT family acetyltransferase